MRKRIPPGSRRGSLWLSLARWSKAYCHSQSTTRTTPWSLASSCLLLLPSSTSCSKLAALAARSEEHTSELQSQSNLVCRLLLEKKKKNENKQRTNLQLTHRMDNTAS